MKFGLEVFKNKKAFTLIEVMAVVAIIGILSSIVIVSMQSNKDKKAVETEAKQMESVLREAQNNALSGKKQDADSYPCEYSVERIDATSYRLAYKSHGLNSSACNGGIASTFTLKNGVEFGTGDSANRISFTNPDGKVGCYSSNENQDPWCSGSSNRFVIKKGSNGCNYGVGRCATVCVSKSGKISNQVGYASCSSF